MLRIFAVLCCLMTVTVPAVATPATEAEVLRILRKGVKVSSETPTFKRHEGDKVRQAVVIIGANRYRLDLWEPGALDDRCSLVVFRHPERHNADRVVMFSTHCDGKVIAAHKGFKKNWVNLEPGGQPATKERPALQAKNLPYWQRHANSELPRILAVLVRNAE
ncbi:MAG: hypothetical protein V4474_01980 [Patescibacteria group bacterium]